MLNAIVEGNEHAVKAALKDDADVNAEWPASFAKEAPSTALHLAVQHKKTDIVKALLGIPGVDVNALNTYCSTALNSAVENHLTDIVELLLKHPKIKPDIGNEITGTSWDIARKNVTEQGHEIRSLLAKKEGTTWAEGEKRRGQKAWDYSHPSEARLQRLEQRMVEIKPTAEQYCIKVRRRTIATTRIRQI